VGPSRRAETLGLRREQGRDGYREVVEEIITALSRIKWLFVIARNSTFTYKSQAIDVKQALDFVDPARVAVLGQSMGGSGPSSQLPLCWRELDSNHRFRETRTLRWGKADSNHWFR
jgi:hypothetical protein